MYDPLQSTSNTTLVSLTMELNYPCIGLWAKPVTATEIFSRITFLIFVFVYISFQLRIVHLNILILIRNETYLKRFPFLL